MAPKDSFASSVAVKRSSGKAASGEGKNKRDWHVDGKITYYPLTKDLYQNVDRLAYNHIFKNYIPKEPIFNPRDKILTMGSCFASELKLYLKKQNKTMELINVPSGLNNSFAVRQYIEWVLTGNRSHDAFWYDSNDKGAYRWESDREQKSVFVEFIKASGFVITFGLSEVWRDKETKNVFWRGVPEDIFDPQKHECVSSTVEENLQNMIAIADLIKEHAGANKHIIYTLSPVPLNASFVGRPTIVSDCVSKSILRVALDQFFNLGYENVHYWPSFEVVRWLGSHLERTTLFEQDARHVNRDIVKIIINNFEKGFFKS